MNNDPNLAEIAEQAALLLSRNLRSKAAIVAHLQPAIDRALAFAHRHETIHSVLVTAGLDISFRTYQISLYRARAKTGLHKPEPPAAVNPFERNMVGRVGSGFDKPADLGLSKPERTGNVEPERSQLQEPHEPGLPPAAFDPGNPTAALDRAKNLVEEMDFKSIGRKVARKGK